MALRQAIVDAMRERNLSIDDLARILDRDRTSISRYIHGHVDPPTSISLKLEVILGVPARTLFADLLAPKAGGKRRR